MSVDYCVLSVNKLIINKTVKEHAQFHVISLTEQCIQASTYLDSHLQAVCSVMCNNILDSLLSSVFVITTSRNLFLYCITLTV